MKSFILLILAILAECHGYSYLIPASFRTAGICFYSGRILPKGDSQIPMVCQNTNCREDGSIMVNGCGRISLPNCTLIEGDRLLKPYPECCKMTYECIDGDGNTSTKEWNQKNPTSTNTITSTSTSSDSNDEIVPSDDDDDDAGKGKKQDYKLINPFILQMLLFI